MKDRARAISHSSTVPSDRTGQVCRAETVRTRKIFIGIRRWYRSRPSAQKRQPHEAPWLLFGAIDTVGQIARAERRNRALDHSRIHLLELARERAAEAQQRSVKMVAGVPDGFPRPRTSVAGSLDRSTFCAAAGVGAARPTGPTAAICGTRCSLSSSMPALAAPQVYRDPSRAAWPGREILTRFHVVGRGPRSGNAPSIDVEERLAGNNLAKPATLSQSIADTWVSAGGS